METTVYDTVIIGGGPGGYTAALYLARGGLHAAVLEQLAPGGQMATTGQVDNYPGFEDGIDGFTLGEKMRKSAERFGAKTLFTKVTAVALTSPIKRITTADGEITAKTVILATGASPRELSVTGEKECRGRGVGYCAACDGMFYRGKTVAVVGGGNSAAADAALLSKLAKKVYLIHRRDRLRASNVYNNALSNAGVQFVWDSRVTEILHGDKVTGVRVENTKRGAVNDIACDGVFIAVGRVPDTALFAGQVDLDGQGYILADETTRTNLPGVFAVGDVRQKPMRQIVTAAADGAVASMFIERYLTEQGV